MTKINKVYPSFFNGVSQQTRELALDSQCKEMKNCVPDIVYGLHKRPPAKLKSVFSIFTLPLEADANLFHSYDRGEDDEEYFLFETGDSVDPVIIRDSDFVNRPVLYNTDHEDVIKSYLRQSGLKGLTVQDRTWVYSQNALVDIDYSQTTADNADYDKVAYYWLKRSSGDRYNPYNYAVYLDGKVFACNPAKPDLGGSDPISLPTSFEDSDYAARFIADVINGEQDMKTVYNTAEVSAGATISVDFYFGQGHDVGDVAIFESGATASTLAYNPTTGRVSGDVTKDGTAGSVKITVTTNYSFVNPTGFNAECIGSVLKIWKDSNADFTFSSWDSWGEQASKGWKGSVNKITDLPQDMPFDDVYVQIKGDENNTFTDYFVKWEDGSWVETRDPAANRGKLSNMPVKLDRINNYPTQVDASTISSFNSLYVRVKESNGTTYYIPAYNTTAITDLLNDGGSVIVINNDGSGSYDFTFKNLLQLISGYLDINYEWVLYSNNSGSYFPNRTETVHYKKFTSSENSTIDLSNLAGVDPSLNYYVNLRSPSNETPEYTVGIPANDIQGIQSYMDDGWRPLIRRKGIDIDPIPYEVSDILDDPYDFEWALLIDGDLENIQYIDLIISPPNKDLAVFKFSLVDWSQPLVGNLENNPDPSFAPDAVNNKRAIQDMFFFKNRLGIASSDSVTLSEAANYTNFYSTTAVDIIDTDVIDVTIASNQASKIYYTVPFNNSLYIFTKTSQYEMSGEGAFTPATVSLVNTSNYPIATDVRPVTMNNSLFFISTTGGKQQLREYIRTDALTMQGFDLNVSTPTYLDVPIKKLIPNSTLGYVLCATADNTVYLYNFKEDGTQRVQSAWSTWEFFEGLTGVTSDYTYTEMDNILYVSFKTVTSHIFHSVDLATKAMDTSVVYKDTSYDGGFAYTSYIKLPDFYPQLGAVRTPLNKIQLKKVTVQGSGSFDAQVYRKDYNQTYFKSHTGGMKDLDFHVASKVDNCEITILDNTTSDFVITSFVMEGLLTRTSQEIK